MDFLAVLAALPGILGPLLLVISVPALIRSLRELRRAREKQHSAEFTKAT